jgi:hypothetical protein
MTVHTIDPDRIFVGIAGDHVGLVCIKEDDGSIRPVTKAERNLALLTMPNLRDWWQWQEGRSV